MSAIVFLIAGITNSPQEPGGHAHLDRVSVRARRLAAPACPGAARQPDRRRPASTITGSVGQPVPLESHRVAVPCRDSAARHLYRIAACAATRSNIDRYPSGPRRPPLVAATATREHGGPAAPRARAAVEGHRHQRSVPRLGLASELAANATVATGRAIRALGRVLLPRRDRGHRASRRCGAGAS